MLSILDQIRGVAPSSLPVLILGERGTGKELFAREVHLQSGRPRDRLVIVNCAAIPTELQDSELFGHRKGSFTGAVSDRDGLFEQADGGTIFLDEIGDLALEAQAKLLRVLETGESRKIGEHRCRIVEARVVAATNHDLTALAASGRFRADLYDRLEGVRFEIPPLRARGDDIDLLVDHFLEQASGMYGKRVVLPDELRRIYRKYAWPGNVRELRQELHRVVLLSDDCAEVSLTTSQVAARASLAPGDEGAIGVSGGLVQAVDETERRLILDALSKTAGNKAQAARMLNMSRTTLIGKMKRLRIA
jgi:transcriptional regulator with GAF, ATPase, and Fis domain